MRTNLTNLAEKFNDQVKTATQTVTAVNKTLVETNDRMLDVIVDTNRKVVDFAVTATDRIADRAPSFELPFDVPMADRFSMPTAAEAGKRYLDVVERLAEMNRDFNERVAAMLPAVKPVAKPAVKPVAKTAVKPVAKKAPARKAAAKKPVAKKAPARTAAATK